MTSLVRVLPLFLLGFALSCATPGQPVLEFSLSEKCYGIYETRNQATILVEETEDIPCELGLTFGVELVVEYSNDRGGRVDLAGVVQRPAAEGVLPDLDRITPDPWIAPKRAAKAFVAAQHTFDDVRKLIAGEYSLRFYDPITGETRYQRSFQVGECP